MGDADIIRIDSYQDIINTSAQMIGVKVDMGKINDFVRDTVCSTEGLGSDLCVLRLLAPYFEKVAEFFDEAAWMFMSEYEKASEAIVETAKEFDLRDGEVAEVFREPELPSSPHMRGPGRQAI